MHRWTVVACAAVAAALVPAAWAFAPAPRSTAPSGLFGIVRKGPTRPVCQVGVPCTAPFQTTLVFTRLVARAPASRIRSSAKGAYRLLLAPGYYRVALLRPSGLGGIRPRAVHVRPGHVDRIDFLVDTGIR